jgi:hypothetical protein
MTGAGARELLTAARTARAGTGPGALADYPVPGGDARLLIHYAPGEHGTSPLPLPGSAPCSGPAPDRKEGAPR